MAGSKTWRTYLSDNGQRYSIQVDKSNASALIGSSGVECIPVRQFDYPLVTCNIVPRFVHAFDRDNLSRRGKFIIGAPLLANIILQPDDRYLRFFTETGALNVWIVTGYIGEVHKNLPHYHSQVDTGLQDGSFSN